MHATVISVKFTLNLVPYHVEFIGHVLFIFLTDIVMRIMC